MSIVGFVRSSWRQVALRHFERRLAGQPPRLSLERAGWHESLRDPTAFYFECLRYFHQRLPSEIKAHRAHFQNARGDHRSFGEHPFHVMWYLLVKEFKPQNFIEIGVFRGQTISLVALCARLESIPCQVYGTSPFEPAGDAARFYRADLDYYADTLAHFDQFGLPRPALVRAYSNQPAALDLIGSRLWDLMYIDGGHEYEVVRGDWAVCSRQIKPRGLIIMDDAALNTAFAPPTFVGSRGLPGPSQVTDEIDRAQFREILQVGHNRVFQRIA